VAVEVLPAIVATVGGVVTAWLRHRGRVVRLQAERDAAVEERDRLRARVDALEQVLFDRMNIDTPVVVQAIPPSPESPCDT
jgi:hypothetical protein